MFPRSSPWKWRSMHIWLIKYMFPGENGEWIKEQDREERKLLKGECLAGPAEGSFIWVPGGLRSEHYASALEQRSSEASSHHRLRVVPLIPPSLVKGCTRVVSRHHDKFSRHFGLSRCSGKFHSPSVAFLKWAPGTYYWQWKYIKTSWNMKTIKQDSGGSGQVHTPWFRISTKIYAEENVMDVWNELTLYVCCSAI